MHKPDVVKILSTTVDRDGIEAVAKDLECHKQSLIRYMAFERPVPFTTGWKILRREYPNRYGAIPNLPEMLDSLHESYTLGQIGDELGLDADTVGAYISGKRKRILFDTGYKIMKLAGVVK